MLITWDIYEIKAETSSLTGVMLRGRIRKFCLQKNKTILVENAEDTPNCVRFAIETNTDASEIISYISQIIPDTSIQLMKQHVANPVLSKLSINNEDRYTV